MHAKTESVVRRTIVEEKRTRARGAASAFSRRGCVISVLLVLALLAACSPASDEKTSEGEAPIPIAATHREIVVVSTPMKADLTFSMVGLRRKGEKDDGSAGWKDRFEEQVEAPHDGFVRRRFRVTLANGSDEAREYAIEIDYVSDTTGEVILNRRFRKIFVPPFTRKQVSGYTPIREDRLVHADARVREVEPGS